MKIEKIKKLKSGKYKIDFDDHSSMNVYDEVILNNNLLFSKEIDNDLFIKIDKENQDYTSYSKVLKYALYKMRSTYEITEYMNKLGIDEKNQEDIIHKLKENHFLDDLMFIKSFISDKVHLTNNGPYKIKTELLKYKVDPSIVDGELNKYPKEIFEEKLQKLIEKKVFSNTKDSIYILKQKLIAYFINLGYDREMIITNLNSIKIENSGVVKKEYDRLYKKLSKKYQGEELNYQIKSKLYQKGFSSEDINIVI